MQIIVFFKEDLFFDNDEDIKRAKQMGIKDLNRKYDLNEIVSEIQYFQQQELQMVIWLKGINIDKKEYTSETLVTHKSSNTFKVIRSIDNLI